MQFFRPEFAARTDNVNPSVIRQILKLVSLPNIISFAGGMPPPELFPYEDLRAAAERTFDSPEKAIAALQYGPSEGYVPLRQWLSEEMAKEGLEAPGHEILVTTGSQQGIDLVAKAFIDPGDEVVVGNPTFLGALQSFSSFQARFLTVPMDEHGLKPEALTRILEHHKPKLIYAIPTYQNPTGICMSSDRRAEIYAIARVHGVPILEDDPYGDLYFGDERPVPIKALDRDGGVMLLRTFSKILSPGLRLGYAVLPTEIMTRILPIKQCADLHSSGLNQVLVHEYLATGKLTGHLEAIRGVYRQRRDRMLAAMASEFPSDCSWTRPEGGLFVWVTLPTGLSSSALLEEAVSRRVAFIPGQAFFAYGGGDNTFRLNFSNASEAQIDEGISRLGVVLHAAMRALGPQPSATTP